MKKIRTTVQFDKMFLICKKRFPNFIQKFRESLVFFLEDKESVKDHPLRGKLKGLYSFSLDNDLRVVYKETDDFYLFTAIGDHEMVY